MKKNKNLYLLLEIFGITLCNMCDLSNVLDGDSIHHQRPQRALVPDDEWSYHLKRGTNDTYYTVLFQKSLTI